ncbi:MAG: ATP synthase subunit C [halophilic archaeon J07HB67]|jgi:ATP synthase subunit C.|nr:MAG: ATP synthase subunit C [halophilic archaeon J07HB67]
MLETVPELANVVLQEGSSSPALNNGGAAAIAVGLAAIGVGYAQRGIGAAAIGAIAEDDDLFVPGLVFTALPETLILFAFVTVILA